MQADHVGLPEQVVQLDHLGTLRRCGRIDGRVDHEDASPEGEHHPGDSSADRAVPDQPDGRAVQFGTTVVVRVQVAAPLTLLERLLQLGKLAQGTQHQSDGMLGGGAGVASRGRGNDHSALGCRRHVHVDRAAATADQELEVGRCLQDAFGERAHLGDRQLDAGQSRDQLLLGITRLVHLRDPPVRRQRPRQRDLAEVEGDIGQQRGQRLGEQIVADEVVAGEQGTDGSHRAPDACARTEGAGSDQRGRAASMRRR